MNATRPAAVAGLFYPGERGVILLYENRVMQPGAVVHPCRGPRRGRARGDLGFGAVEAATERGEGFRVAKTYFSFLRSKKLCNHTRFTAVCPFNFKRSFMLLSGIRSTRIQRRPVLWP